MKVEMKVKHPLKLNELYPIQTVLRDIAGYKGIHDYNDEYISAADYIDFLEGKLAKDKSKEKEKYNLKEEDNVGCEDILQYGATYYFLIQTGGNSGYLASIMDNKIQACKDNRNIGVKNIDHLNNEELKLFGIRCCIKTGIKIKDLHDFIESKINKK